MQLGMQARCEGCAVFRHPKSSTMYMQPTSPGLQELQASLQSEFAECSDNGARDFHPHLSLGHFSKPAAAERAAQVRACLSPVRR